MDHGATQVERVLDMVASGMGSGWLNSAQARRHGDHQDVAVRPLTEAVRTDSYLVAWRAGPTQANVEDLVRYVVDHFADDAQGVGE